MVRKAPRTPIILTVLGCLVWALFLYAEPNPAADASHPSCRLLKTIGQNTEVIPVAWTSPSTVADKAKLDRWCETVGPALYHAGARSPRNGDGSILVVDWNINVGNGDIPALIAQLTEAELAAGRGKPDFVFLLQEVFRRGPDLPPVASGASIPGRISSPADDIQSLAAKLNWWMFYVPSMRNGDQTGPLAEDRGNAILSSLPLEAMEAIELPFSVQRRVAITATVRDARQDLRFKVATVHLDTRAPLSRGFIFGAASARNRQTNAMIDAVQRVTDKKLSLIVGGDFNSYWGPFESSIDTFSKIVPRVDCGAGSTHKTGLTLDHVFARLSPEITPVSCSRPNSRYQSDHYPLVLSLDVSLDR
jgi:endonuclease/exonuclease/phosphatase family metal-dependent hydrolase